MLIYKYLPRKIVPESFEELTFEEFYDLYAQADCARELIIDEIRAGVAQVWKQRVSLYRLSS